MEFQYKGLEATLEKLTVTEEELDRQVERLKGQDMGELTPEQIRQGVAQALQAHYDEQAEMELRRNLLRMASATLNYVPSEAAVQDELDRQMGMLVQGLAEKRLSLTDYCSFANTTPEKIREDLRSSAEQQLREEAAVERIAALEQITVDPKEVEACIAIYNYLYSEEGIQVMTMGEEGVTFEVEYNGCTVKEIKQIR